MFIGKKIKEIRETQGMSLSELAERSKVQIATLSRLENLKMTGSLESHMNIARALGVDITKLYAGIVKEESRVDVKTQNSSTDVYIHNDKSSYEILTNKVLSKKIMPILLQIEPEGKTNKEENLVGTEKFIYVIEGKVMAYIGQENYSLSKGNSLYFDASLEHYFENENKTVTRIICVSSPVTL